MGFFSKVASLFSRRERVNLLSATPNKLKVIPFPDSSYSDQKVLPGMAGNPDPDQRVLSRGLTYFNRQGGGREWIPPQYDHLQVEIIFDVESYFTRATRVKKDLFLKEGFEFIGTNDERVEYIRARVRQIAKATGIPFEVLLLDTCRDLLVHSNAYWLKIRNIKASGGRIRKVGNKTFKPVAGYFRLAPETMIPEIDTSGNIVRWKQSIGGEERIFSTDDIVHFYTNRKAGYPLGVPSIIPVIDDIRALRSLEHNIDILIHKHLFPIILWKVGTPERPVDTYADGTTEIDIIKDRVANMPTEGSLVVSERFDVKAIGAENKALRVETYLDHFKKRIFAGLDISSIDVGEGNTATKSTAHTLSRNVIDTVKLHQIVIEKFLSPVIEELLLESTFDQDKVLLLPNMVYLKFHEIDKEAKQAQENHLMDIFLKNGISYPEFRMGIGREVLTPEEEKELYWNKFGREEALIGSVDELSGKGASPSPENKAVENKNKPANQHGTRQSTKLNRDLRDLQLSSKRQQVNPILAWHNAIGAELQSRWAIGEKNLVLAESDIRTSYNMALSEFVPILKARIRANYPDPEKVYGISKYMETRAEKYIRKLRDDVLGRLKEKDSDPNVVFSALAYRAVLIFDTEISHAENISIYRWLSQNQIDMKVVNDGTPCNICRPKLTTIKWNDKLGEAKIPSFHPGCSCRVKAIEG